MLSGRQRDRYCRGLCLLPPIQFFDSTNASGPDERSPRSGGGSTPRVRALV
jgi:hypothetical protein